MKLILEVEGKLPKGINPIVIKVEPKKGTFELRSENAMLASGQFVKR